VILKTSESAHQNLSSEASLQKHYFISITSKALLQKHSSEALFRSTLQLSITILIPCTIVDRGGCKGHVITTLHHIVLYSAAEAFGCCECRLFTWWPAHGVAGGQVRMDLRHWNKLSLLAYFSTLLLSLAHIVGRSLISSMGQCLILCWGDC